MKNLHKPFCSAIAIFLSLGVFAINASAQYESSTAAINSETATETIWVGDEYLVKSIPSNNTQENCCLHSVLYTFNNSTMTIDDVYEQNTVSKLP